MNALAGGLGAALTPQLAATIALAFVVGGVVKGTLGVGLPLVVVPLLSLALPTPTAIGLVAIPVWRRTSGRRGMRARTRTACAASFR